MIRNSVIAVSLLAAIVSGFIYYRSQLSQNAIEAMSRGQYQRAGNFLRDSSIDGSAKAKLQLGNLHFLGLGTKRDPGIAVQLYREAGIKGNTAAQYNLALMHHNGFGTTQDNVKAAAWFLLADSGGNPKADTFLRTLTGQMNPNMIQQAYQLQSELSTEIENSQAQ